MEPFTLDELSALSAEQAVASRFDESNFRQARWILVPYALAATCGTIAASISDPRRLAILVPNLLFALIFFFALRRERLGRAPGEGVDRALEPARRLIVGHPRAAIVTMLVVLYLSILLATLGLDAMTPLLVMSGFFALFFRMRPVERLLVHGSLLLFLVLVALLGLPAAEDSSEDMGTVAAVSSNHCFILAIGLVTSRRRRREILALFSTAQASAKDQLRMRQELDYAREIQLAMLPESCPPQGWLDICSLSWPATEVGGDYYDYFQLGEGRLAIVVGDVAGHGMASGLLLAGVRSCLTILAEDLDRPLAVLAKLNLMVQQTARRRKLVTLAIVVLDPIRRIATVANAGHPPVLLSNAAGVAEIALPSLPLGTQLEPNFGLRELPLEAGDVLLLHSDGLYEGDDPFGEPYGMERLAASLGRVPREAGAVAVRDALLADFGAFQRGAPQRDDLTFVVVKVGEGQATS
ncbi:MAG TPA: PP2C family protein-serine/threonine phosphatase [Thermoanaerobaculia bacterium]|nr:PP2C family protein-serine/threonine phosphatase [Thermoanaerobaculia bacterium]